MNKTQIHDTRHIIILYKHLIYGSIDKSVCMSQPDIYDYVVHFDGSVQYYALLLYSIYELGIGLQ